MSTPEARCALSQLAQSLVHAVLILSQIEMASRHGQLPGHGLAVIAYGSLGACVLGFDSDLDLIFLYQSEKKQSDGARPIPAERYHTAVARRMLSLLSATTPSGRLYSIDARLRPNGRAGLLVSSVDAFSRYQLEDAWIWELQALTRARPVAGSPEVAESFTATRKQVLTATRDKTLVKDEISDMRERISIQHNDASPLKHAPGGVLDIEFVVQLGLLLNADNFPDLIVSTEVKEQLLALQDCGWLNADVFRTLDTAYSQMSHASLQTAISGDRAEVDTTSLLNIAQALCDELLR
jgi:glutamate-ammonia-ligase adenylyltransferase